MSRSVFPFAIGDISVLARSLNAQLAVRDGTPSHVELLNMLVRSAGFRNFQHFRAARIAQQRLENPPIVPAPVDHAKVERVARHFDPRGRLLRWPGKASHREPCLWALWSRLEPRQAFTERQISATLDAHHLFGDHALLRRELFDRGLVTRTADGRQYLRIERAPPPEALALIQHLGLRQAATRCA